MLETVADVAQRFRLRLHTGPDGADRPIRWTHISELVDPTPWLRGGELLLSLGLQLDPADSEQLDHYVQRLAGAGTAGLAFGTGARHAVVPAALVSSALRHRLPLLEIPGGVAFQDITYQLNADLLRMGTAESRLVAESISAMVRVARSAGAQGVVTMLASRIDSWAVLMDRHGAVHAAVGAARVHIDDARAAALGQRSRIRHPDLIVHAVGDPVHPRAHLVVAARPDRKSLTRELAQHASVLLDLALHPLNGGDVWGLARADAVDVLLSGDAALIKRVADRWSVPAGDIAVALLRSRSRAVPLADYVLEWCDQLNIPPLISDESSVVTVLLPADELPRWKQRVSQAVERESVPARCGLGSPQPITGCSLSRQQAEQALEVAVADALPVIEFSALSTSRLVLHHLDASARAALTTPLLPLLNNDTTRGLLRSLRVFLSENASWEAASSQLGIHRHTLRQRMSRVEELTGLSISSVEDRIVIWLALQALQADQVI